MISDPDGVNRFSSSHGHSHAMDEHPPPPYQDARLPPLHRVAAEDAAPVSGSAYYPPSHFSASRLAAHQYSTEPPLEPQYHDQHRQEYGYADGQHQGSSNVVYTAEHFQPAGPAHPHAVGGMMQGTSGLADDGFIDSPSTQNPPSPTAANARRHTTADIGSFKSFTSGPFQGRMLRAEIVEVQKADLGRKCADPPTAASTAHKAKEREKDKEETRNVRKDRRPLDPPPVVRLRLFECHNRGTPQERETEIPPDNMEVSGLVCQVDIFRVTIPPSPGEMAGMHWTASQSYRAHPTAQVGGEFGHPAGAGSQITYQQQPHAHQAPYSPYSQQQNFTYPPRAGPSGEALMGVEEESGRFANVPPTPHSANTIRGPGVHGWGDHAESPMSPVSPTSTYTFQPHGHYGQAGGATSDQNASIDPDALPPPSEADKLNRVLFGESFTHACNILDLNGQPTIFFVFADLSVKLEGLFRPRYRFFDLFSRAEGNPHVPILAECFGGCFAVYSTKEFPGLKRSTDLTKHLSRWGIRVNIRETERKRRDKNKANADEEGSSASKKASASKKKGRSRRRTAVDSSSTTSDDRQREGGEEGRRLIPRGVDAPRRYLEDTTRGKKRTRGG